MLRLGALGALAALAFVSSAAGQISPIPGDLDRDADVDQVDVALFIPCMSGAMSYDPANLPAGCALAPDASGKIGADCDRDGDVDQQDFGLLQRCLSGSLVPANPGCVTGVWQTMPGDRTWARQSIIKECNYIVDCSFTELATHHSGTSTQADAYGVLNDIRISQSGPDWVRPGEAAMGAIGLMTGAERLHAESVDISRYDQTLDHFFLTWLLERRQPIQDTGTDYDAIDASVVYDASGDLQSRGTPNAGVSGQIIVAMWKYGEYKRAIGQSSAADQWLQNAWPVARNAGEFIARNINWSYKLVRSNSSSQDLWITDGVFGAAAMKVLDAWSDAVQQTPPRDYAVAYATLGLGLAAMADNGSWKGFYRLRTAAQGYQPGYGDKIDQLCFLPYDSAVLDCGGAFARSVSDFWTNGVGGGTPVCMTPHTASSVEWQYYGTYLQHYFDTSREENRRLSPGANLQLARMEWRRAAQAGDAEALQRAWRRLVWVADPTYSGLWYGATGAQEAGVGNGIVDWRMENDRSQSADGYERFLDTSAYFLEVLSMLYYGADSPYIPQ